MIGTALATALLAPGCLTDTSGIAIGQTPAQVTEVAAVAPASTSSWTVGGQEVRQRIYDLCEPTPLGHTTLTVRFVLYQGTWRANVVDTHIGPEK